MRGVLIGSERITTTFRGTQDHVPNVSQPRLERITTTFGTYRHHVRNVLQPRSERIATTFRTNYSPQKQKSRCRSKWTDN